MACVDGVRIVQSKGVLRPGQVETVHEGEGQRTVSIVQPDGTKRYYVYERHGRAWYEKSEVEKLRAKGLGQ